MDESADQSGVSGLLEAWLPVTDLDRAIDCYDRLGLSLDERTGERVFVAPESGRGRLALVADDPPAHGVVFAAGPRARERLLAAVDRVGGSVGPIGDGSAAETIGFADPFGNELALRRPADRNVDPLEVRSAQSGAGGASSGGFITGVNEAHLIVEDLDTAVDFYGALGCPVAFRDEDVAFVWTARGRSWLGCWLDPDRCPTAHVALGVPPDRFGAAEPSLADRGVELRTVNGFDRPFVRPHQANASAYFHDSEGNDLEFLTFLPADDVAGLPPEPIAWDAFNAG